MKRALLFLTVSTALVIAVAAPAAAAEAGGGAGGSDSGAVGAFVASATRYETGLEGRAAQVSAAGEEFVDDVSSRCDGVLESIPPHPQFKQDLAIGQFEIATSAAFYVHALQPVRDLARQAAAERAKLRFTDPVLTWEVRTDATALPALLALSPPDVCADARALAVSGFRKLSKAGNEFATNVSTVLSAANTPASKLLRRMRGDDPGAVAAGLKALSALDAKVEAKTGLKHHFSRLQRDLYSAE